MTTPTTAEQVNAVVREFGQGQMVDVLDIDNVRFIAKSTVQTLVHNMAQGILSARATIARLEGEMNVLRPVVNKDMPVAAENISEILAENRALRTRADAATRRVEALTSDVAVEAAAKASWELVRDAVWDDTTDEMKALWRRESLVAIRAALAAASGDTATTEG